MTDLDTTAGGDRALDPDEVSSRTFPTAFRGFDPVQVRAFLGDVADELRRLRGQEEALRRALAAPGAPGDTESPSPLADAVEEVDDRDAAAAAAAAIVEEARSEADRLLREARERVEQLGAAATAETTRVLEEARAEAERLRATATDDLKGRFEEAEATAVRKIAEAEREAASIRVAAREEADATIEAARDRGREMVAEAQAARERMLADLAKRKRAAQAQLEQLRAGRDRLLDTLKVARRSIDEMTTRFDVNEAGAGATNPPTSGVPSGPVTTTPGAASTDARPRAAVAAPTGSSGVAPDRPRPVRARAVAIGEAPQPGPRPQSATPQPAARPHIAAPQALAADAPPATRAEPASPAPGVPPEATGPAPAAPEVAPRGEERRSSALRILRRNKGTEAAPSPPPLIGRDSPSEGVRIIGRPASAPPPAPDEEAVAVAAPEPEPEVAALAAVEAPAVDRVGDTPTEVDHEGHDVAPVAEPEDHAAEAEAATQLPPVAAPQPPVEPQPTVEPGPEPAAVDPGPVEPLAVEEIRPRIEDLFARIRADRETATASARQVLASADDAPAVGTGDGGADVAAEPGDVSESEVRDATATTDADEHRLQARDAITEPLVAQLTKRLKRALQDEQNATLDRLRTSRGPARVDQVLSRPDDQALPYRHLALPFLDAAARAGSAASPHGPVAVAADDLAAQLAEDLAGAVRARLDAVLQAAASDDLDLASLSERLSAVYREWKVQKVERLANHYLVAAHERGGFLAHPEGTPLRWLVDDDGPCPDCDDNALAGPTPRGEPFPTGQLHPPAHLGCRCLLTASPA